MSDRPSGLSWGRIVVGALLVVVGAGWLLQTAGIIDFPLRALTPIALIVIGIGLVAGSRRGSYPGLIAAGAIITVFLAVASSDDEGWRGFRFDNDVQVDDVEIDDEGGVGDRVERPRTEADLHAYRAGAGRLTIDLTSLRLRERTYEIEARAGAGEVRVIVPRGVPIRVEARSGVGNVQIFGRERSTGFGSNEEFESRRYDECRPRFDLELRAGVGSIRVVEGRPRVPVRLDCDGDTDAASAADLEARWIAVS